MKQSTALEANKLYQHCDTDRFDFETTNELDEIQNIVGQDRVISSIDFGVKMKKDGFNIFALGPNQTDKRQIVEKYLTGKAKDQEVPRDICYVNNFEESQKPKILKLPAGKGKELRNAMESLIEDLDTTLIAAFESEEYQNRKQAIQEEIQEAQGQNFTELQQKAREKGLALVRTPAGFSFAPIKDGDIMSQNELEELSEEEQEELEEKTEELQEELQAILRQMPARKRKIRERLRELDKEIATYAIKDLFDEVREQFKDLDRVQDYLDKVQMDIVENVQQITGNQQQGGLIQMMGGGNNQRPSSPQENPVMRRYKVNVIVDHSKSEGAPVVYEDNPNYKNLIGRVEYQSQMGALTTDFNLIKAGALHRANGGYLIVDARRVLLEPFAWEGLKRTLKSGELKIESPGESYGLISTVSLEPEPDDLDVKVILLGERLLYYLLCEYDPEFRSLFKVEADFADEVDRSDDNQQLYAQMIAGLVRENELRPLNKEAVGRVIERSARLAGDNEKLSAHTTDISDLLLEADHWAGENGNKVISSEDVQKAIDEQVYRSSRLKDKTQESIERDYLFIDTSGEEIGQINGLSVLMIGNLMFGRPSRITARVQLGKGDIIDIEREVEMSGPIHSKGVLILKGFLGERYALDQPLSLSASLVFEQSYSGIDGDSASSAELYTLLSAISEIPIKQSLAVTGSVNQHGRIQPIGGVNEKIEGFFDICKQDGLTGDQGVLIPASNVKNLMLKEEVVEAVDDGNFYIYPVETIDQGMELLTGKKMGVRRDDGSFPKDSINYLVSKRLSTMAERRKLFAAPKNGSSDNE